ncbi:MAG: GH3 auxin-responsive promoter family protein [Sphingobacteriales bacterium]|nr:MAG: GH3 auxin-responsive promoter family protein [Sphingobacteriales bacterium]
MKIKSFLARPYAAFIRNRVARESVAETAIGHQEAILQMLFRKGCHTSFGKDHHLHQVTSADAYKSAVPLRDYEAMTPYIDAIKAGKENILWPGKPMYLAKTSGTTSGAKYIPISKDSIANHIDSARNALLCYAANRGNSSFADGRMIFLSGSPVLERIGGIPTGRLSGIVNHFIPAYLRTNQLPSYETNCIEDWETKLDRIVAETIGQDMRLISGIPPWMQMYFDWLQERSGKTIKALFPNLQVLVHGGVAFEPYKKKLFESLGGPIDTVETFPASEGFFAWQDTLDEEGLLLNTHSGIYFEFVPAGEVFAANPTRLSLSEVKTGENYALIVSTNAGLWSYNTGDTVRFVSTDPYRLLVTGRIKHFISAFGEHVIGEEVESALKSAVERHGGGVIEFTVAPQITPADGSLPHHEWWIAFETLPEDLNAFAQTLDEALRKKNIYYDDLLRGGILQPLKIQTLPADAFIRYMRNEGKLGGQNKVPRLSNDRKLADALGRL